MQPAYPGRELVFTRNGNIIESNGVFFHQKYVMTPLGEKDSGPTPKMMIGLIFFASRTASSFTVPSSNMVMNHRSSHRFSHARCDARKSHWIMARILL